MTKDISDQWRDDLSSQRLKESWVRIMRGLPNYEGTINASAWFESAKKLGLDEGQANQVLEWSKDDGLISHRQEAGHLLLTSKGVILLKESTK